MAEELLKKRGYRILERNFHLRGGEIDLIALDGEEVVFVEVKSRTSKKFGELIAQISSHKQKALIRAAETYLMEKNLQEKDWRIDIVTILLPPTGEPEICHHQNAVGF